MKLFNEFFNLYKVNKTLKFSLKPLGKTQENIKENGLLKEDEKRSKDYAEAKKIIDEYHKDHIAKKLSEFKGFDLEDLENFKSYLSKVRNDKSARKKLEELKDKLRSQIHKATYDKKLFDEDLIQKLLPQWLKEHPEQTKKFSGPQDVIKEFSRWTTYFTGFHENRKNVYTKEDHSTSIGYRLIHDNLPKFIDNINSYAKAKEHGIDFSIVEQQFGVKLEKVFSLDYFNKCLTQKGIDNYNQVLGGKNKQGNIKEKGVNEILNEFAQKNKDIVNVVKKCKMEPLYKQILSDRNILSFKLEAIDNDKELCEILSTFSIDKQNNLIIKNEDNVSIDIRKELDDTMEALKNADKKCIYIKNEAIRSISNDIFESWHTIRDCMQHYAGTHVFPVKEGGKVTKKLQDQRDKYLKQSYFSIDEVHEALSSYFNEHQDELENNKDNYINEPLLRYFDKNSKNALKEIQGLYTNIENILQKYQNEDSQKLKSKKEHIDKIKNYLDAVLNFNRLLKQFYIDLQRVKDAQGFEKDQEFYSEFDPLFKTTDQIVPIYNKVRNYLTKKLFSTDKYKLNFQNSTLADGWDKNKEKDNTCVILLKDKKYFLGIMNHDKDSKKIFDNIPPCDNKEHYKKMEYKQISDASKDIQNIIKIDGKFERKTKNLDSLKKEHIPDIFRIKKQETYKTTNTKFNKNDLNKFIDYYKEAAQQYWDWCNFSFYDSDEYESFKLFTDHVNKQGYKLVFKNVAKEYIDKCIEEGKLYLFEIYSKDFSTKTRGNPNLQTIYWKALFESQNLNNVVYKLDGQAELFYRKASIKYNNKIKKEGHHANDPKKKQKYPIIKDKRYAVDTYLFHVPITCNFQPKNLKKLNDRVNEKIVNNPNVKIIGIDRGERHLAYYSIIDSNGKIIDQDSLNKIKHQPSKASKKIQPPVNYQLLLDKKEKEREQARQSWDKIENIKDLKTGYLSQVVHKITKLMIEHNAIVVFEDLNFGFKRGRFRIEKQVYQKLEKALIDKLNYLIFKDKKNDELGGTYKALQLTEKFDSFKKLGKQTQTGAIFYVPAYHTSKVCPETGFVNLIYPKYESIATAKRFFNRFDKICYNPDENYFEFYINYENFEGKAKECHIKEWIVCSYGKRLKNSKNKDHNWETKEIDITKNLTNLFSKYNIDYVGGKCLKNDIGRQTEKDFFKELVELLKLTLKMRNSRINSKEDYLISPVQNNKGEFFDSRKANNNQPKDADANGAYHIALKGLCTIKNMDKSTQSIKVKPVSNEKWYEFIQTRNNKKSAVA